MHIRSKRIFSIFVVVCFIFTQMTLSHSAFAETTRYRRLFGSDRYGTAVEISKGGWTTSKNVVIARGDSFPDALCAGTIAKKIDSPILLTESNRISEATLNEIKRLGAENAYVIGGIGAISEDIVNVLKKLGLKVERIAGKDRCETSVKIAEKLGRSDSVAIATAEDFPDALSIFAIAANLGMPILLTERDNVPKVVQDYIRDNAVSKAYIIGGQGVISDKVMNSLPNPVRLFGKDRYETNIEVIKYFKDKLVFDNSFLATGENFADALTGAVLAAKTKRPIILTGMTLPKITEKFIIDYLPSNCTLTVIGGTAVVPQAIVDYILYVLKPPVAAKSSGSGTGGSSGGGGGGSSGGSSGGSNYIPVSSIELTSPQSIIAVGDYLQFTTTVKPSDATDRSIKWSISGDSVCVSDGSKGLFKAVKSGIAEVTAITDGGRKSAAFKAMVGDIVVDGNGNKELRDDRHVSTIKEAAAQRKINPSNSAKGLVIAVRPGKYNEEAPIAIDRTMALYGPLYNIKTGPGGRYSEEAVINFCNLGGESGPIWPGFVITADNVEINGFTITCSSGNSNPVSSLNISSELKDKLTKLLGIMEDNYKSSNEQSTKTKAALNYSIPTQNGIGIVAFGTNKCNIKYNEMYGMNFGIVLTNISLDGRSVSGNSISNNYIHGNRFAFVQGISGIENTTFMNNSIIGNNVGVGNLSAGKLDASNNWWNSADERDITPLIIDLASILSKNKYYNVCYFPWAMDSSFSTFVDGAPCEKNCVVASNDNNNLTATMIMQIVNKDGNVITNLKKDDFVISLSGSGTQKLLGSNVPKVIYVYSFGTGIYEVVASAAAPFNGTVDICAKNGIIKSGFSMGITGDVTAKEGTLAKLRDSGLDGDRNNSYACSMAELGDYIYIGTNRNVLLSSALSLSQSNLNGNNKLLKDPEILKEMVTRLSKGDIPDVPADSKDSKARLLRYNTKTGEIEQVYDAEVMGYSSAVKFTPKGEKTGLYFGSYGGNSSYVVRIEQNTIITDVTTPASVTTTGSGATVETTPSAITPDAATTVSGVKVEAKQDLKSQDGTTTGSGTTVETTPSAITPDTTTPASITTDTAADTKTANTTTPASVTTDAAIDTKTTNTTTTASITTNTAASSAGTANSAVLSETTTVPAIKLVYEDKCKSICAMTVYNDELYIDGKSNEKLIIGEISNDGHVYIKSSSNPEKDNFVQIATSENFNNVIYADSSMINGAMNLISYKGYLYVFLSDPGNNKGFTVYRGKPMKKSTLEVNSEGWEWTEIVGDGCKYPSGLGNLKNAAAAPFLFTTPENKTYVYVGTFTSVPEAVANGLQGNYDGMKSFMNPAQVYRFYADQNSDAEQWEMIVGNPNDQFSKEKGNYFAGFFSGSDAGDSKYMANHYVWAMAAYHNKLFVGTLDASTLYDYVVPTTGSAITDSSASDLRKMVDFSPKGFDFFVSNDGVNFSMISRNGFGDKFNYGLRTLLPTESGLYIGTANPFYGAQLWRYTDGKEQAPTTPSAITEFQLQDNDGKIISMEKGFNSSEYYYNVTVGADVKLLYIIPKADTNTTISVEASGDATATGSKTDGKIRIDLNGKTKARVDIKVKDNTTGKESTYAVYISFQGAGSVENGGNPEPKE